MKLTFRDLKQQKFTIDAEGSDTIGQVKEKIAAEKGWEASQQKLIYSGKILADANTVESYNIEEKGFIVCMLSKPKAAPSKPVSKAETPSTPTVSASTPAQPPAPQPNPPTTAPVASNPPATPTPSSTTSSAPAPAVAAPAAAPTSPGGGFNDPSAFLVGNSNESTVREMEAMGFQRPEIQRALRAAYFNPDRAIEYLLGGIPPHIEAEMQRRANPQATAQTATSPRAAAATTTPSTGTAPVPPAAAASPTVDEPVNLFEAAAQAGQGQGRGETTRSAAGAGAGTGEGQVNMDFLRNSPHFQHLRQLVQQHPAMLQPILQQVAQGNPQLAQMIGQNQEQFLQLLAEDAGVDAIGGMGEAGPLPPGATPISVTEEERDAIERLCRLGFSRDQVIQAYFACDKNEELAANFLFDQPDDDEQ